MSCGLHSHILGPVENRRRSMGDDAETTIATVQIDDTMP